MKRVYRHLRLVIIVALVAFAVCWASNTWLFMPALKSPEVAHGWLHNELHITADEEKKLHPIEERFDARKKELEGKIRDANVALGKAIMEDKRYSDRVQAAVDSIHHAQGELQKATLEHLFEMQAQLTPQQAETLNSLAANALFSNP
jgi:Spy/CpxP family protein refolding chaperone